MKKQTVPIIKLSKDYYINLREETGELREFQHKENRAQSPYNVAQSLQKLRDLLNTNVTDSKRCRWLTLTYKENMQDPNRLYQDFRKFNQRFQYYLKIHDLPKYEYISAVEPQARGAWHIHIVLIFDSEKAPFISNTVLEDLWGLGFVKIKSLQNVDNIGLYLSAYLGDMELADALSNNLLRSGKLKTFEQVNEDGTTQSKAVIKGARLRLYPPGIKLFRHSRGIKYPVIKECTEEEAMNEVGNARLTFEKTIQISSEGKVVNVINYRHYNRNIKKSRYHVKK